MKKKKDIKRWFYSGRQMREGAERGGSRQVCWIQKKKEGANFRPQRKRERKEKIQKETRKIGVGEMFFNRKDICRMCCSHGQTNYWPTYHLRQFISTEPLARGFLKLGSTNTNVGKMRCRNQCKVRKIYVTNWQVFSCLGQRFTPIVIDSITHSRTKTYIHSQEVKVQSIAPIVFMGGQEKGRRGCYQVTRCYWTYSNMVLHQ